MATRFCSVEDASQGVEITGLRAKIDFKKRLKHQLEPLVQQHVNSLRTVVVYVACHGLQLGEHIYLVPPLVMSQLLNARCIAC